MTRRKPDARSIHDGSVKGQGRGGLADQAAANFSDARAKRAHAVKAGQLGDHRGNDKGLVSLIADKARMKNGKRPAAVFGQDLAGGEGKFPLGSGKKRKRAANAQPSGGGGGIWAEMNRDQAKRRAAVRDGAGLQTASLKGGLALGLTTDPYRDPGGDAPPAQSGTSIFDPVLCELAYRWFCPPGGLILDPFAGGSVRGVVASHLGRRYLGVDLRAEQAQANDAQLVICRDPAPRWIVGDAIDLPRLTADHIGDGADMVFSCPPYGDLEVYSEDPRDLSAMPAAEFDDAYARIIGHAVAALRPDRFAAFVVGDYRDADGFYRGFVSRTIEAFEAAGARLYNEAILVTALGSLPVRTRKQFVASRKLGKTHQNFLVFCKGDPKAATAAIGPVEFGELTDGETVAEDRSAGSIAPVPVKRPGTKAPKAEAPAPLPEGAHPASRYGEIL